MYLLQHICSVAVNELSFLKLYYISRFLFSGCHALHPLENLGSVLLAFAA
jgi:hypothetical protein